MNSIIAKTFGGLSAQYYIRQFLFGLLLTVLVIYMLHQGGPEAPPVSMAAYILFVLNALLYPYSRFVYESVMGYIMGNNVFFLNAIVLLVAKLFTMVICWSMAIFIAPLGLIWLYVHHSHNKAE
jgi:hypothetical protein